MVVCTAAGLYTTIANVYRTHAALRSNCGVAMTSRRKGGGGGVAIPQRQCAYGNMHCATEYS